jgi:hypothetical protein
VLMVTAPDILYPCTLLVVSAALATGSTAWLTALPAPQPLIAIAVAAATAAPAAALTGVLRTPSMYPLPARATRGSGQLFQ